VDDDNDDAGGPEGDGDEHEGLGEQGHVGEGAQLKDLGKVQLFPLVVRRQFVLKKRESLKGLVFLKNYKISLYYVPMYYDFPRFLLPCFLLASMKLDPKDNVLQINTLKTREESMIIIECHKTDS